MAFNRGNFTKTGATIRDDAQATFGYKTEDAYATVVASGYFNEMLSHLRLGDIIEVVIVTNLGETNEAYVNTYKLAVNSVTTNVTTDDKTGTGGVAVTIVTISAGSGINIASSATQRVVAISGTMITDFSAGAGIAGAISGSQLAINVDNPIVYGAVQRSDETSAVSGVTARVFFVNPSTAGYTSVDLTAASGQEKVIYNLADSTILSIDVSAGGNVIVAGVTSDPFALAPGGTVTLVSDGTDVYAI